MKICLVCPTYPPSERPCGVGDYTRILAHALARRGNQVTVWTRAAYGATKGEDGVRVVPFCDRWDVRALRRAAALARREELEVIDIQYAPELYRPGGTHLACLPLWIRWTKTPSVPAVSFHTLTGPSLASHLKGWLLLRGSRGVISTNEEVTYLLGKHLPGALAKAREIPIGSNIPPARGPRGTVRASVRARWGIPEKTPLLAHFGQFYPGKGAEVILQAASLLAKSGQAFRVVMIGDAREGHAAYLAGLRARAESLGLGDRVLWTGARPEGEVAELLAASDLYVVPYDAGASARRGSLMAGLAAGLAVVSTTPRIPSAYFRDGENMVLVPPRDAPRLAGALRGLLADAGRRERLALAALGLAGRFAWDGIAERTEAFFRELAAVRKR